MPARTRKPVNKENTTVTTATETEPTFDVDVDAPQAVETTEDTVATPTETAETEKKDTKSTRPAVPEGKVSPVAFAHLLSEHLRKEHPELGIRLTEGKNVAPQVVYSYIKNNGPESKNPFPAEKSEGRAAVVDPQAGLDWWDAKDLRVKAQKAGAAEKAANKAAKASEKKSGEGANAVPAAGNTEAPALVEAE